MSTQPKVSVVVPIYGVEKYLRQCVDSILAQTLKEIEIILVDDGSKDKCPEIVDEYAKKDSRIVAIHQPNGGYGRAVNHGIEVATGEYIGIVEPDDWIAEDMYETLYKNALSSNAEIVKSSFIEVKKSNDRSKDRVKQLLNKKCFTLQQYPDLLKMHASIWSAIYKQKFIKSIKLVEDIRPYEDLPFAAKAYSKAQNITIINYAGYFYRTDASNSTNNAVKPTIVNYVIQRSRYRDILIKSGMYTKDIMETYWLQAYSGCKCFLNKPNNKYRKIFYTKMQELLKKALEDNCEFLNFTKEQQKEFNKILKRSYLQYAYHKNIKFKKDIDKNRINFQLFKIKLSIKLPKLSLQIIFRMLDSIMPKNKKKIIFSSNPDFSDNAKEFYEYMKENHDGEYRLIWVYEKKENENYTPISEKYYIKSLTAAWHILTAKYLVTTWFNLNKFINMKKHTCLQLWHGMPLKTLGYNEKDVSSSILKQYKTSGKHGYFFVSSDIFKLSMIASFLMKPSNIFITGQPKTDCILTPRNKTEIAKFINASQYDKIVIYAPTYKEAKRNKKREVSQKFENIFYFDDYDEEKFYQFLENQKILFIIKPHPFDEPFYRAYKNGNKLNHPNIKVLFDRDMKENNFYFYDFFKFADLMITDFSSIGIDWLISKKPIIFLNQLSNEYNRIRGFILEDNYEILMPGEKVANFEQLRTAMQDALTIDNWKEKREKMLPLLYKYFDSNASARIYEIMKGL